MLLTFTLNGLIDELRTCSVHGEHVEVDSADLGIEVRAYRAASCDVSLHDVANDLDDFRVLQTGRVLVCLSNDAVPLLRIRLVKQNRATQDLQQSLAGP
jgi:hypothetical protein